MDCHGEDGLYYDKQISGYGKRERQDDSRPVERGRSKEVKAVRNGIRWETFLPSGTAVLSRPELQPRGLSVLATAMVCVDVSGYCHHIELKGKGCTEPDLFRTGYNTRENWSYSSPATALERVDPGPCLGTISELTRLGVKELALRI